MEIKQWQVFLYFSVLTMLFLLKPGHLPLCRSSGLLADTRSLESGHIIIIVDEPNTKVYLNDELEGLAHPDCPMVRQFLPAGDVSVKIRFPDQTELSQDVLILPDQTSEAAFHRTERERSDETAPDDASASVINNRPLEIILQEADKLYDLQRYTTPEDNNAFLLYQYVLKKDPDNTHAKEKIAAMMSFYHSAGTAADNHSDLLKAEESYGKYLKAAQTLGEFAQEYVSLQEVRRISERKTEIETLLETVDELIKKGDVYYMPAGRVHALGPGILLAEIQQTSDVTYRIYDWDRIDQAGMSRELHIEEALDAIDFKVYDNYRSEYPDKTDQSVKVVESPYFTTNLIRLNNPLQKDYSELDSFVVFVCVEGRFRLDSGSFTGYVSAGEALLLPAVINHASLIPDPTCSILEVFMVLQ
jgi:mannose-6-phosphate isomerase-like protein (cupin superfamily)